MASPEPGTWFELPTSVEMIRIGTWGARARRRFFVHGRKGEEAHLTSVPPLPAVGDLWPAGRLPGGDVDVVDEKWLIIRRNLRVDGVQAYTSQESESDAIVNITYSTGMSLPRDSDYTLRWDAEGTTLAVQYEHAQRFGTGIPIGKLFDNGPQTVRLAAEVHRIVITGPGGSALFGMLNKVNSGESGPWSEPRSAYCERVTAEVLQGDTYSNKNSIVRFTVRIVDKRTIFGDHWWDPREPVLDEGGNQAVETNVSSPFYGFPKWRVYFVYDTADFMGIIQGFMRRTTGTIGGRNRRGGR